jgi:hypothetical protein
MTTGISKSMIDPQSEARKHRCNSGSTTLKLSPKVGTPTSTGKRSDTCEKLPPCEIYLGMGGICSPFSCQLLGLEDMLPIEKYSENRNQSTQCKHGPPIFNPLKTNEGAANCRTSKGDETNFEQ